MNVQHWAVFFVAILSCNYASAFFFGRYKGVGSGYDDDDAGYYGWSKGCSCRGKLTTRLDRVLSGIKPKIGRSYNLLPQSLEEYELKDGRCSGLNKFERKGPYRCTVTRDYARIIFRIGFVNLLIHYKLSILNDILSTFMGGFASTIFRFFGRITDFAFRCGVPDFEVSVVLRQDFGGNGGLYLEGFYPSNIGSINFLGGSFGRHSKSITPYLRPVFDHVLRNVFTSELLIVFRSSFRTVTVDRENFSYKYGGRYNSWTSYKAYRGGDDDGDSSTSYSGRDDGGDSSTSYSGRDDGGDSSTSYSERGDGGDSSSTGGWSGSNYRTSYTDGDSGSESYTYEVEEDDD